MRPSSRRLARIVALSVAVVGAFPSARGRADEGGWVELNGLDDFRTPTGAWEVVGDVHLNPTNAQRLAGEPGRGVLYNGPAGRAVNLVTKRAFGDVEVHAEFLVPKGSNSGIKLGGVYEVQIFDSFGKSTPTASDNGGIYPRAELLPTYHHIDDGYPPRTNASKPPGEWQALDISFRAPRFDEAGRKVAPARFVKVVLNGQVVHQDQDVPTPTGHAWHDREHPTGPILLQADHGPVAFRHLRVRSLAPADR